MMHIVIGVVRRPSSIHLQCYRDGRQRDRSHEHEYAGCRTEWRGGYRQSHCQAFASPAPTTTTAPQSAAAPVSPKPRWAAWVPRIMDLASSHPDFHPGLASPPESGAEPSIPASRQLASQNFDTQGTTLHLAYYEFFESQSTRTKECRQPCSHSIDLQRQFGEHARSIQGLAIAATWLQRPR